MSSKVEILNPLEYPGWDDLLLTNENYSFFHSSSWARVLCESYKFTPLYFTSIDNGRLSTLIPIMEVKSLMTGKRGASLPFTDYCQAIAFNQSHFQKIIQEIIDYGKSAGWKSIELRNGKNFLQNISPSLIYYAHTLELTPNEQDLLLKFRSSTRRNITKAIREGVSAEICNSLESIKAFYRLNCITRKRHGLPPQPFYFFRKIFDYLISKGHGHVILASHAQKVIAGALYLHFGKKAIFKFGASNRHYHHLRSNNLVMWEAIKWYAQNGFENFNFGRTEPENEGLLQFKRGWGTTEKLLNYYKYDFKKASFINEHSLLKGLHNRLFNAAPIFVSKFIGSVLYRHIG